MTPDLGRFLQVDPVDGGSANDYDYTNQDPVNGSDVTGECAFDHDVFPSFLAIPGYVGWEVCRRGHRVRYDFYRVRRARRAGRSVCEWIGIGAHGFSAVSGLASIFTAPFPVIAGPSFVVSTVSGIAGVAADSLAQGHVC